MNELKKIIVEELEKVSFGKMLTIKEADSKKDLKEILADNIISKFPKQVITEADIVDRINFWFEEMRGANWHNWMLEELKDKELESFRRLFIKDIKQILQDNGWESLGEVKITEENIDNVGYRFKKYIGKNIEIAEREVKSDNVS